MSEQIKIEGDATINGIRTAHVREAVIAVGQGTKLPELSDGERKVVERCARLMDAMHRSGYSVEHRANALRRKIADEAMKHGKR